MSDGGRPLCSACGLGTHAVGRQCSHCGRRILFVPRHDPLPRSRFVGNPHWKPSGDKGWDEIDPTRPRPRSTYTMPIVYATDKRGRIIAPAPPPPTIAINNGVITGAAGGRALTGREGQPLASLSNTAQETQNHPAPSEVTRPGHTEVPVWEEYTLWPAAWRWSCCRKLVGEGDERCRSGL